LDREFKRGKPVERLHGKVIGAAVMDSKLFSEVLKREEGMAGIELFLVLPMTAFHLAIVPGCVGPDQLVVDSQFSSSTLK